MSTAGLTDWYTGSYAPSVPVVLSAPHGGWQKPADIQERTSGCLCEDAGSLELARAIRAEFGRQLGAVPHLVASQLHRTKLDANRGRDLAASPESHGALAAWDCYHGWIREALEEVVGQHGFALLLDIHGQDHRCAPSHVTVICFFCVHADLPCNLRPRSTLACGGCSPDASELGYGLSAVELLGDDASLDSTNDDPSSPPASTLSALLCRKNELSLSSLVRGPQSLGSLLERHGYASTPSSSRPFPVSEDALRSTLSAALVGVDSRLPSRQPGQTCAQHRKAQEETVVDVLEDLLVRHGYAESKLDASVGAATLLPFTQGSWVARPVVELDGDGAVTGEEAAGRDAIKDVSILDGSNCGSTMVDPPSIEPEPEPQSSNDVLGVYFGGAYTVRCYGAGAEVRSFCVALDAD